MPPQGAYIKSKDKTSKDKASKVKTSKAKASKNETSKRIGCYQSIQGQIVPSSNHAPDPGTQIFQIEIFKQVVKQVSTVFVATCS